MKNVDFGKMRAEVASCMRRKKVKRKQTFNRLEVKLNGIRSRKRFISFLPGFKQTMMDLLFVGK